MKTTKIENRLLASHIADNVEFESACLSGDAKKIMMIVHTEMEKNNLHSDGSNKPYLMHCYLKSTVMFLGFCNSIIMYLL